MGLLAKLKVKTILQAIQRVSLLCKQCVDDLSFLSSQEGCEVHYTPWMFTSPETWRSGRFSTFRARWRWFRAGVLSRLQLTPLCLFVCRNSFNSPIWAPHWAPKSVTNTSFILSVLLDTLQLATGATGLWSQGTTAVIHGCSIRALGPILGDTTLLVDCTPSAALWNWVPSRVLPRERDKQVSFSVTLLRIGSLRLEGCDNHTVVSNTQVQGLHMWHTGHCSKTASWAITLTTRWNLDDKTELRREWKPWEVPAVYYWYLTVWWSLCYSYFPEVRRPFYRLNLTTGISSTLCKIVPKGLRGVPTIPYPFGWPPH